MNFADPARSFRYLHMTGTDLDFAGWSALGGGNARRGYQVGKSARQPDGSDAERLAPSPFPWATASALTAGPTGRCNVVIVHDLTPFRTSPAREGPLTRSGNLPNCDMAKSRRQREALRAKSAVVSY